MEMSPNIVKIAMLLHLCLLHTYFCIKSRLLNIAKMSMQFAVLNDFWRILQRVYVIFVHFDVPFSSQNVSPGLTCFRSENKISTK